MLAFTTVGRGGIWRVTFLGIRTDSTVHIVIVVVAVVVVVVLVVILVVVVVVVVIIDVIVDVIVVIIVVVVFAVVVIVCETVESNFWFLHSRYELVCRGNICVFADCVFFGCSDNIIMLSNALKRSCLFVWIKLFLNVK